jgi:hypothetical protein
MTTRALALLLSISFALAVLPLRPAVAAEDPRYFPQTRYRVDDDRFWDFFNKRGGVRTFGYPISASFTLLGHQVQIFQRQIMQRQPDGSVATMNLLDQGLMPYTAINGSKFPAPDPSLAKAAPKVGERDYHTKVLEFVKDNAPDVWQGQKVNFYTTFLNTVRFEDAFPDGKGHRNLLPGLNLEIWGLPTSKPTPDPTNSGFIYQRFQRGIMHYRADCNCTEAILLADYLKAIITGQNLPGDLDAQAQSSPFYKQYDPTKPNWVRDPSKLSATDLTNAFTAG